METEKFETGETKLKTSPQDLARLIQLGGFAVGKVKATHEEIYFGLSCFMVYLFNDFRQANRFENISGGWTLKFEKKKGEQEWTRLADIIISGAYPLEEVINNLGKEYSIIDKVDFKFWSKKLKEFSSRANEISKLPQNKKMSMDYTLLKNDIEKFIKGQEDIYNRLSGNSSKSLVLVSKNGELYDSYREGQKLMGYTDGLGTQHMIGVCFRLRKCHISELQENTSFELE